MKKLSYWFARNGKLRALAAFSLRGTKGLLY